jgi:selenocysteine lyase/cysteine desulfurase
MTPEIRALFPIAQRLVYLNHAAVSPLPTTTLQAIELQLRDVQENGSLHFQSWLNVKNNARRLLAAMLGCRPSQVAFMRNTSDSLSTIANGLKWHTGDNIVTFRREFPSNIYPWIRIRDTAGVELRMCGERDGRVDVEELESMIDQRTRIVAISHVQFASGYRIDLERIGRLARKHCALLVADVIQSLGVLPIDVEAQFIDVAAGASHKWLLGPEGVGYLYLSDRAREMIEPTLVGWVSVPNPDDYDNFDQGWNQDALPWETGTGAASLFYGLEASLKLLTETGTERIASWLEQLTDQLCTGLDTKDFDLVSSRLPGEKSQIVCIRHSGSLTAMDLYIRLKAAGIITAPRSNRLRIAPHFYNTADEIDLLLNSLS